MLIGIFMIQASFCQEHFTKGYIIDLRGDTVRGQLDYRNWENNPKDVQFRAGSEVSPVTYSPEDIQGFGVSNDIYVSASVDVETSPRDLSHLTYDAELQISRQTVFLQVLYRGEKSLYLYKNGDERFNFYILQDSSFELLIYKRYLHKAIAQHNLSVPTVKENNKYRGQLNYYLHDCPGIMSVLEHAEYNKEDMESIFLEYYSSSVSSPEYQKGVERATEKFGILAGMTHTSFAFKGSQYDYLAKGSVTASNDVAGGLSFEVVFPRNFGKMSIYNELLYSGYDIKVHYLNEYNSERYEINDSRFTFSSLSLATMLRFYIPTEHVRYYFNGGVFVNKALKTSNDRSVHSVIYSSEYDEVKTALPDIRKYEEGIQVGAGVKQGNWSAEARYLIGTGMSKETNIHSYRNTIGLFIGYQF